MKDKTATMCHNVAKYNREHRHSSEMTPLEAADKLSKLLFFWENTVNQDDVAVNYIKAVQTALIYLEKIGNGELVPVRKETHTLSEWAAMEGIVILDPDGFDRTDPQLMEKQFTHEEYEKGIYHCTIMSLESNHPTGGKL